MFREDKIVYPQNNNYNYYKHKFMNQTGYSSAGPRCFGTSRRTSFVDVRDDDIPGPGSHKDSRVDRQSPTKWKFGTSTQRDSFLEKYPRPNPSPAQYEPNPQPTHSAHPKYSIPKNENVLPGEYKQDQNSRFHYRPNSNINKYDYPKYSFGYAKQRDYSTAVPAPNSYRTEKKIQDKSYFNKTQSFFTNAQRPLPYGQQGNYPGIGSYDIQKQKIYSATNLGFGISEKDKQIKVQGNLPIKYYDVSIDIKQPGKGYTMRPYYPQIKNKDAESFPGPNHYNPKLLDSKKKIISFTSKRKQLYEKDLIKYPSPQKHVTSSDFYKTRKSLSFTKQARDSPILEIGPGPAKYNMQTELSKQKGYMGRKTKKHQADLTPSGADYNPADHLTKPTSQRVINYETNRADFSKSITGQLGPGNYEIDKQTRKQLGKMSKSLKFNHRDNKHPGPGFYQIPTTIGKLPKYYSGQKKITATGFSTFALEMTEKARQRQLWVKRQQEQKQRKEQLQQRRREQEAEKQRQ